MDLPCLIQPNKLLQLYGTPRFFGDHCFATAGPTLWKSLPEQLRQPDITFRQFTQSRKTFMVVSSAAAPWNFVRLMRRLEIFLLTYP